MASKINYQSGQTMILLIFFVMTALAITVASISMMIITSGSVADSENGINIGELADSGTENALIQLIRNPFYTGETYVIEGATITIVVTGDTTKTISTTAVLGDFRRTVEVLASYANNVLSVTSWKEVY